MTEPFVTIREFEGFSKRMDGQFMQVTDSTSSLHGKIDSLLLEFKSEAKSMGAMEATVKAVVERLGTLEGEVRTLKDAISNREAQKADSKIGWFREAALVIMAAVISGFFVKYWK